jgi:hypothetical protein
MRKRILAVVLALFWAWDARAQGIADADAAAIRATIERQIAAFRADDGERAFAFADATIQAMFGSPERFMAMVREGYATIYRPRGWAFGPAEESGGIVAQIVEIDGLDGTSVAALYHMRRQPDGTFRIAGVQLLRARRPGV